MAKSKFSLEEAFQELEQLLSDLDNPELGLSDSMSLYKKGVRLLDQCSKTLDQTEKEILILQEGSNGRIDEGED